jgi:uncharacterized protein (DUF2267 family)
MVVLNRRSMAYQAARAMADNHIGAVLVSEPQRLAGILTDRDLALAVLGGELDAKTTPLGEVMSEEVVTCDIGADLDEVARLMREHAVRRVPVMENGRPVGLITFDDLVVDGSVGIDALRSIVAAQLEVEAPQKPAGMLHPGPRSPERQATGRVRALMRAKGRAEASYLRLVNAAESASGLDRGRAERGLLVALGMLCRRLTPQEAGHLVAQLPSMLQSQLDRCLDGPDRTITEAAIATEFARVLGLEPGAVKPALQGVFRAVAEAVTPGQIAVVRGQLPEEIKNPLPMPAA